MKKLNHIEMSSTQGAGCGKLLRLAKRAAKRGDFESYEAFANMYFMCVE